MNARSTSHQLRTQQDGFSFVEVLVTAALVALVFGGLFAAVQAMINLISDSKAKAGAVALATERMEYIRSLDYVDVGTVSGVPNGTIPQYSSTTLNSIVYDERVLVEYVDDDADGVAGADSNGIVADYKRVKIEYSWTGRNGSSSVALVSNIVPPGVETTAGGGTLRVYVNDASVQPVAGAEVRFVNTTGTSTIDTIRFTDPSGLAQLGGAPALSDYEIYVSRAGYSTDGTSIATGTLSSPAQPVVSVAEASVTTQYFQIDRLSDLNITTASNPTYGDIYDTFTDSARIATTSSTTVGGGAVALEDVSGSYAATGTVQATTSAPAPLERWYSVSFAASTSASTSVSVQVQYLDGGVPTLVPDSDLPGNSSGFTSGPIDISTLDGATYPELLLLATLTTIDSAETPVLHEWNIRYVESQPVLSGIPMTVTGSKVLGTDTGGSDVPKNVFTDTTDGSGEWSLTDIEYDTYSITIDDPSYDVLEACPSQTISLAPNTSETVSFTIGNVAGPRLLVAVTDVSDAPVADATVRVEQGGYDVTQTTSLCGQTFFTGGLSTATATVTVSKSGYTTQVEPDAAVSATSTISVQIN